jgi:hypothetical protein
VIALAVTSPGWGTTNYAAIMLSEGNEWKVLATVPITTPAPATSAGPTR